MIGMLLDPGPDFFIQPSRGRSLINCVYCAASASNEFNASLIIGSGKLLRALNAHLNDRCKS